MEPDGGHAEVTEGALRFTLFGPVRAWCAEQPLNLGAPRQRSVAAALLLHANRPVAKEQLILAVWGEPAPAYAVNQLQKYVSALRRVLEPGRAARASSGMLNWSDSGYVLELPPRCVDLAEFEHRVGKARGARAGGDVETAAAELHGALELWRSPALANVASDFFDAERDRLAELRSSVLEDRIRADLDLGRHAAVVPELSGLVADSPLRERLTGLLMLALYRSGRQSDALQRYDRTRRSLRDELGMDPGTEIQELQRQILASDPSLSWRPPARRPRPQALPEERGLPSPAGKGSADRTEPSPAGRAAPPFHDPVRGLHQLPMDISEFVGREAELRALRQVAEGRGTAADLGDRGVVIAVVEGMAGVGKTRLAVHAAHQFLARGCFPDVQLWADLKGFSPDDPPADPARVLEYFLRLLGVPGDRVPEQLEARAALYRDRLAGKRALVLLDDAADEDQLRWLLPGSSSCLLLVTSRRALAGLDGSHAIRLGAFTSQEAVALIDGIAGPVRHGSDRASRQLAELSGHLPLAVAIAGRKLRTRPAWSTADLAERLDAEEERLPQLSVGNRAVSAAFDLSYETLPAPQRRAFRLLALHPGEDLTADSAAALLDTRHGEAESLLESLLDEHLVQQHTVGRYRYHNLLRLYARDRVRAEHGEQEQAAVLQRLARWYCTRAEAARHDLEPWLSPHGQQEPAGPARRTDRSALRLLQCERANLLAVSNETARRGWHEETWRLAAAAHFCLGVYAYGTDSMEGLQLGLDAARRAGGPVEQARALRDIAFVHESVGRHEEAAEQLRQALILFEEAGDLHGAAEVQCGLGRTSAARGRYRESRDQHGLALSMFRQSGDRHGEALALSGLSLTNWFTAGRGGESEAQHRAALVLFEATGDSRRHAREVSRLGMAHWFFGEYEGCLQQQRRALALFEESGDRRGAAIARTGLGLASWHLGRPTHACTHYEQALAAFRDICDVPNEAATLQHLGYVHWVTGLFSEGEAELRHALALCGSTGDRSTEAWTLVSLGYLCQRQQRNHAAERHFSRALDLSRSLGDRHSESSALVGLALVRLNQSDVSSCDETAGQALTLAREIGNPHGEAWAMIGRGLAHCAAGSHTEGADWHQQAVSLARRTREPFTEAAAHNGLGSALTHLGRYERAERHLRTALAHQRRIRDQHGAADTLRDLATLMRRTGRPEGSPTGPERTVDGV